MSIVVEVYRKKSKFSVFRYVIEVGRLNYHGYCCKNTALMGLAAKKFLAV